MTHEAAVGSGFSFSSCRSRANALSVEAFSSAQRMIRNGEMPLKETRFMC